MGKSSKTTDSEMPSSDDNGNGIGIPFVNFLLYVLCVTSLGTSVYLNYRQTHLEDRVHHLRHLDDRITILEAKFNSLPRQTSRVSDSNSVVVDRGGGGGVDINGDVVVGGDVSQDEEFTDVANVVRKLSLQVAGIQRLRRDVSHLQLSRRTQRQASIQQSPECVCPAGKPFFHYFFVFY